jgi:putative pyruvate formate lyase activating enzyme
VGDLVFSADGLAKRGVLLRHLVMPGLAGEGRAILDWVVATLGRDMYTHVMEQYVPRHLVGQGERRSREGWVTYGELDKRPQDDEVAELQAYARSIGLWRFEEAAAWESGELAG